MSILDQAPLVDDLATECAEKVCGQANAAEVIFEYMVKVIELAEPQAHAAGVAAERARCVAVLETQIARYEAEAKYHAEGKNERAAEQMWAQAHGLRVALLQVRQ